MAEGSKTLIRGGTVWQGREQGFREDWDVLVDGSTIEAVGPDLAAGHTHNVGRVLDAGGKLVAPGFVNAHTHAAMTLLRSYADDLPLQEWLQEKIWPVEAGLTAEDVYWGTLLAIVEMVRAGVTTFADNYFQMHEVARAVSESGVRASLSPGLFDGPDFDEHLARAVALIEQWHGKADGRIRVMLGPHSPYAAGDSLTKVGATARRLGVPVHIHIAETRREVEDITRDRGVTPVQAVADSGLFESHVLAAHCVHVTDDDLELLRMHDVYVAHNPTSNMKLGSGKAPVQAMLDRGIVVALGTDGTASNNNLDLLEEARLAAFLAKMDGAPSALPAPVCLEMATVQGARAVDFAGVGLLAPGYQADLILIDTDGPHWAPPFDACANLIYSASSRDVTTVMVAGELIMKDRVLRTLDEAAIKAEASRRGLDLARRAGARA